MMEGMAWGRGQCWTDSQLGQPHTPTPSWSLCIGLEGVLAENTFVQLRTLIRWNPPA